MKSTSEPTPEEKIEYTGWRLDHFDKNFEKVNLVFSRMIIVPEENVGQAGACIRSNYVHRMDTQTVSFELTIDELLVACGNAKLKKYGDMKESVVKKG
ncbi:MAG: hypothetical protein M0Q91_13265 [Methanoregula sp.]|nr:hypothetical protein [Methanoregula sp.]